MSGPTIDNDLQETRPAFSHEEVLQLADGWLNYGQDIILTHELTSPSHPIAPVLKPFLDLIAKAPDAVAFSLLAHQPRTREAFEGIERLGGMLGVIAQHWGESLDVKWTHSPSGTTAAMKISQYVADQDQGNEVYPMIAYLVPITPFVLAAHGVDPESIHTAGDIPGHVASTPWGELSAEFIENNYQKLRDLFAIRKGYVTPLSLAVFGFPERVGILSNTFRIV